MRILGLSILMICLGSLGCEPAVVAQDPAANTADSAPPGMAWIPPGEFTMGWDGAQARSDEGPAHRVRLDGYYIDITEVTNAQFRAFVDATGYLTTAERPVDWEELKKQVPPGTPKPPDDMLAPGSLVFTPLRHSRADPGHSRAGGNQSVNLDDYTAWWTWTHGADWRHPQGPDSSIDGRDAYPVVHISWEDAQAYCQWAGKRLPTEAEWERAARFGHDGQMFIWGDDFTPGGQYMANTWQGNFPIDNTADDGFIGAAPVKSFPPNAAGLYDMAGNVWEWTSDQFRPDTYAQRVQEMEPGGCCINPTGPTATADPRNPFAPDSRVHKGGSFLCNVTYCSSYRPSAKMATSPDSSMNHLGFRCVMTKAMWDAKQQDSQDQDP